MNGEGASMYRIALALLFASAAYGQDLSRTFQLKNTSAPSGTQEIATTLRIIFDITQVSIDVAIPTITVTGNSDQIALAEWLIPKLDVEPGAGAGSQKYLYAGNTNDVVEVIELKNAAANTNLQEMLTTLRTVADIQKIYQSSAPKILIMRSDPGHIAMADFLTTQLDQPAAPRASATIQSFQPTLTGNQRDKDDGVIVYGLMNAPSFRDLQAIITTLRTVLQIQRIFQYTSTKMLAIRTDPDRIQMAEWLIPKLDLLQAGPSNDQVQFPGGKDDVVKVFYVSPETDLGTLMQSVRTIAKIPVLYQNFTPPALVVRSTADQVAMAGQLIAAH
jgi:hypothetical protein